MNAVTGVGMFLVAFSGLLLLRVGWGAIRQGPVSGLARAVLWSAGFWLVIGGLLVLLGRSR